MLEIFIYGIILLILIIAPAIRPLFHTIWIILVSVIIGCLVFMSTPYYQNKNEICSDLYWDLYWGVSDSKYLNMDINQIKDPKIKHLREQYDNNNCYWY